MIVVGFQTIYIVSKLQINEACTHSTSKFNYRWYSNHISQNCVLNNEYFRFEQQREKSVLINSIT